MLFPAIFLAACVSLLWPSQADAQIYAWRDAKGTLVLSDRKLDASARTYEVPGAPEFRSTRPLPPQRRSGSASSRWSSNTRRGTTCGPTSFAP